jgi:hypothetical protein
MSEITTIQIHMRVRVLLDGIKKETGAKSYEAVIMWLAKKAKVLKNSELGAFPELQSFKRQKHDRFD